MNVTFKNGPQEALDDSKAKRAALQENANRGASSLAEVERLIKAIPCTQPHEFEVHFTGYIDINPKGYSLKHPNKFATYMTRLFGPLEKTLNDITGALWWATKNRLPIPAGEPFTVSVFINDAPLAPGCTLTKVTETRDVEVYKMDCPSSEDSNV